MKTKAFETEQLCWSCANSMGGCSWSMNFEEVKGWKAKKTIINQGNGTTTSYQIKSCPCYKFDIRQVTAKELSERTGIISRNILSTPLGVLRAKANFKEGVLYRYDDMFVLKAEITQNADTCVCCGAIIPEGTQICVNCKKSIDK